MISSIGSSGSTQSIQELFQRVSIASSTKLSSTSFSDRSEISSPGKLFGQLQELSSTDPSKFKEVTAQIASELETAAASLGGSGTNFLSELASKFRTASETGDVSLLEPPTPPSFDSSTYDITGAKFALPTFSETQAGLDLEALFASISETVNNALSESIG